MRSGKHAKYAMILVFKSHIKMFRYQKLSIHIYISLSQTRRRIVKRHYRISDQNILEKKKTNFNLEVVHCLSTQ